ncbi:amidohydrolase family protein [Paenibacillus bouchesdurhonensis]|uniref:hypothetical protein n=1 Tax=Paenibacillus bouchesdurhonensis TaxID=1870990 RepID=UPI000DA622C0|nr:hypothetical protein [Paenibacillus bouchesdurhonensis]
MLNKINLLIHVATFPFKDLEFYGQEEILQVLSDTLNTDSSIKEAEKKKNRNRMVQKLHKNILLKCSPNSLDEINLLMAKFHPMLCATQTNRPQHVEYDLYQHYFNILEEFSESLISHRDGEIIFKYWKSGMKGHKKRKFDDFLSEYKEQDKVHFFHSISRFIPMDILVAVHYSINSIYDPIQLDGFYQHVNLADAPLHDVLERGVAENHIHATAAFNFSILWESVMNDKQATDYLRRFETNHLATSTKVYEYILTAQLLRMIMVLYLDEGTDIELFKWLKTMFGQSSSLLHSIHSILTGQKNEFENVSCLQEIIEEVKKTIGLYDGDRDHDFIYSIIRRDKHIKTYGENIFLQMVMKYKESTSQSIVMKNHFEQFFRVFFKYAAIKNEFYQQVTQATSIQGLDFFRGYFDRATDGFSKGKNYYKMLLRTLFQNSYLKMVELRLSLQKSEGQNRKTILSILQSYHDILKEDYGLGKDLNSDFPRIGIIYHLIKQADDIEKCWSLYEAHRDHTIENLHYGKIQQTYLRQIEILQSLRKRIPLLTNFIVGIDAASLENNTPVQVFSPVFAEARDSQYDSIRVVNRDGYIMKNQSLFFTFHAGEDFRHINSGLRRMDEVISYCKFHSGDRIGHGIALGVNVKDWVSKNPVVVLPRGEYLDNLLWIWGVYSKSTGLDSRTYVYLEQRIYEVAKEIFQVTTALTIPLLYEVYQRRFKAIRNEIESLITDNKYSCSTIRTKDAPDAHNVHIWGQENLFLAYHCKRYLERMTEPVYVNTTDVEESMSVDMQNYLIQKISKSGIVIEVNPSSNEAIGEIDSIFGNQLFRIQSPDNSELSNIMVNINSDDPMVFNTNVSNEIAYLYYGMLKQGIGKEAALIWIEKLRKSGMDTSFIRGNTSNQDYIYALETTISALEDPFYCDG